MSSALAVCFRLSQADYIDIDCQVVHCCPLGVLVMLYQSQVVTKCIILADSIQTTFCTCSAVEITAAVTGMITLVVGVLASVLIGALLFYCISKHQSQRSKPKSSSHHQQQAAVVPPQRAGPEYEEVVELKENMAYGPVQSIELKACEAYVPVQH